MNLVFSGDKHIGLTADGESRLDEQRDILAACEAESAVDVYVDLGDLFHRTDPSPELIALAISHARSIKAAQSYWLVGNHDRPTRGDHHALMPLSAAGFEVVAEPMIATLEGGLRLLMLPFVWEWTARQRGHESAQAWLDAVAAEAIKDGSELLVAGHLEVDGSEHSSERDIGLRVPTCLLHSKRVKHIWLGHVHKHQKVGKNVTIVGSAVHADFGEINDPKGIMRVDL